MKEEVTRRDVQAWLEDYYRSRPDLGLGKAILAVMLDPANLFETPKKRPLKKSFLLFAIWFLGLLGVFIHFNLWS